MAGLLPGYYASFLLIDVWGRRPIQLLAFAMLLAILGKMTDHHQESLEEFVDVPLTAGTYPGTQPTLISRVKLRHLSCCTD
jgi:hypothetical protein